MQKVNIAILDDHLLFGNSLKKLLLTETDFCNEISTFTSISELEHSLHQSIKYDILLLDVNLGDHNGLDYLIQLKDKILQGLKVIIISSEGGNQRIQFALKAGVSGYLSKNASTEELIRCIEAAVANNIFISEIYQQELLKSLGKDDTILSKLTPRETLVLDYLCAAYTAQEIAYTLKLSTNTIQMYIKSLFKKFNKNRTTDLVLYATQNGLNKPIPE